MYAILVICKFIYNLTCISITVLFCLWYDVWLFILWCILYQYLYSCSSVCKNKY